MKFNQITSTVTALTQNLNSNPKTDPNPNPKSKNNVCSTKRHRNKVQHSVIYTGVWVG